MKASTAQSSVNTTLAAALVVLAGVAWAVTAHQALSMASMISGLGQIGNRMPGEIAARVFMGMWLAMMTAMMLPAVAPVVLAHRMVMRQRREGWVPTAAFVAGYLAVWTAIGVLPLLAILFFGRVSNPAPGWVVPAAGAALILAGAYQLTPLKSACLRACRGPLAFILSHDFGAGSRGALLAGVSHGVWCLGCCWALMSVLVVVGVMNLVWMAGLALVFMLEKNWGHGVAVSRVAGAALVVLGAAVLVQPHLLGALATLSG